MLPPTASASGRPSTRCWQKWAGNNHTHLCTAREILTTPAVHPALGTTDNSAADGCQFYKVSKQLKELHSTHSLYAQVHIHQLFGCSNDLRPQGLSFVKEITHIMTNWSSICCLLPPSRR